MLRQTPVVLHFRARAEFDRLRSMMRGRAKLERKVGIKQMTFVLKTQTKYRVELLSYWRKSVLRKGIDSAATEHSSTGWGALRNDLARQNVMLLTGAQANLAKYEPLAFRAIMELCSSRIAPLLPPTIQSVPPEAFAKSPSGVQEASQAGTRDLRNKVAAILAHPSPRVAQSGLKNVDDWVDAWKQFEVVDPKKRLAYRN